MNFINVQKKALLEQEQSIEQHCSKFVLQWLCENVAILSKF